LPAVASRPNPHEAQKIIRVVQTEVGGRKIAENAVVEGHTKHAVLFDQSAARQNRICRSDTLTRPYLPVCQNPYSFEHDRHAVDI